MCSVLAFVIAIETTTPVEKHETKVRRVESRVNRWCTRQKIKTSASAPHGDIVNDYVGVHDACNKGEFSRVVDTRTGIQRSWMREMQYICMCATWVERLTRAREGFLCRRETLSEIAVDNTTIQRAWHARRGFRKEGQEGREGDYATREERTGEGRGEIQRRWRGGFRADTEISPILEGWLATPQLSSCGLDDSTAVRDSHPCLPRRYTTPFPPVKNERAIFLRNGNPLDHRLICTIG